MRFVSLSALALLGCADTELQTLEIGEVETTRAAETSHTAVPVLPAFTVPDGPVATTVRLDRDATTLDGRLESEDGDAPNPIERPIAVVYVIDQNADMKDVLHHLNEPAVAGVRAMLESNHESWFGMVGHVDRRAHLLFAMEEARPETHRLMYGAAAAVSTCSTLEDMPEWQANGYDHPVLHAPPCWADEQGRDPATALAFAQHLLERDAPLEAEKAIIWVGGRPPAALVGGERRPDHYGDQMETWKRTDREVSQDILVSHTSFVVSELERDGVHVLHVPLDEVPNNAWLEEAGGEVTPDVPVHDRARMVYSFIDDLRGLARE